MVGHKVVKNVKIVVNTEKSKSRERIQGAGSNRKYFGSILPVACLSTRAVFMTRKKKKNYYNY